MTEADFEDERVESEDGYPADPVGYDLFSAIDLEAALPAGVEYRGTEIARAREPEKWEADTIKRAMAKSGRLDSEGVVDVIVYPSHGGLGLKSNPQPQRTTGAVRNNGSGTERSECRRLDSAWHALPSPSSPDLRAPFFNRQYDGIEHRSPSSEFNSYLPFRLGLQGEVGVIVAGSRRPDFPEQTESLFLTVAANQVTGLGCA